MTSEELIAFTASVNGDDDTTDPTFLYALLNLAKSMVEQMRPWRILQVTDDSISVAATNTWQTSLEITNIARFNRFHGDEPVKLFDGSTVIGRYHEVPYADRLDHIYDTGAFVYNEAAGIMNLMGTVSIPGTLYINYIRDSTDIDADTSWVFPSWAHPLLAFMVNGVIKGGVDYDEINARMAPDNRAVAATILQRLELWDNAKQLSAINNRDPYDRRGMLNGSRSIDMSA